MNLSTSRQLVFNGINGATGAYGLAPMTVEALSKHISEQHEYDRQEARKLDDQRAQLARLLEQENANKIEAIVRLLAESNLEDVRRDAAWREAWLKKLAAAVADLLPGDEYREPGKREGIEEKLRVDTVDKIAKIARLLASTKTWTDSRVKEMEALLLRDPHARPDNRDGIKGQLDRDLEKRLNEIAKRIEKARSDAKLQSAPAQREWLAGFCRDLRTIPIDAWNARQLLNRGLKTERLFVRAVDRIPGAELATMPYLQALRQKMDEQPRDAVWNDVVDVIQEQLALPEMERDQVSWDPVLGVLDNWLWEIRGQAGLRKLGTVEGVDRTKIEEAGWGIIFPWEDPQSPGKMPMAEIKRALEPLLNLRKSQAGEFFTVYEGGKGYRPGETAQEFLERHDASVYNPADPKKVPYYLLIVGSPEQIPFHFQYQLDVQYAVGRLDFDQIEDYANYARSVARAGSDGIKLAPTATFFGVSNPDDHATELSAELLVRPLYEHIQQRCGSRWQIDAILGEEARKARLQRLLGGDETPALLFAACHGVEFDKDDPKGRQVPYQGALLCQDWRGPLAERGEIPTDYYLAGEDLTDDTNLLGLIGFFFACYSAGTPLFDEYYEREFRESGKTLAEQPFVATLPKAMLSRPKGGALAVVGHVERAWGTSYMGSRQREQIAHFESAIEHLLNGHPIGSALEYFNGRYAALSTELTYALQPPLGKKQPSAYELAELWTANNDARGYIVIGDPAVRLPVAKEGETLTERPEL